MFGKTNKIVVKKEGVRYRFQQDHPIDLEYLDPVKYASLIEQIIQSMKKENCLLAMHSQEMAKDYLRKNANSQISYVNFDELDKIIDIFKTYNGEFRNTLTSLECTIEALRKGGFTNPKFINIPENRENLYKTACANHFVQLAQMLNPDADEKLIRNTGEEIALSRIEEGMLSDNLDLDQEFNAAIIKNYPVAAQKMLSWKSPPSLGNKIQMAVSLKRVEILEAILEVDYNQIVNFDITVCSESHKILGLTIKNGNLVDLRRLLEAQKKDFLYMSSIPESEQVIALMIASNAKAFIQNIGNFRQSEIIQLFLTEGLRPVLWYTQCMEIAPIDLRQKLVREKFTIDRFLIAIQKHDLTIIAWYLEKMNWANFVKYNLISWDKYWFNSTALLRVIMDNDFDNALNYCLANRTNPDIYPYVIYAIEQKNERALETILSQVRVFDFCFVNVLAQAIKNDDKDVIQILLNTKTAKLAFEGKYNLFYNSTYWKELQISALEALKHKHFKAMEWILRFAKYIQLDKSPLNKYKDFVLGCFKECQILADIALEKGNYQEIDACFSLMKATKIDKDFPEEYQQFKQAVSKNHHYKTWKAFVFFPLVEDVKHYTFTKYLKAHQEDFDESVRDYAKRG